ncbi:GNAT family N-acetyltransferase [Sphingomonas sp. KC8]|uniref:GNAT family N-acetyltransferase n=1 Tax=Sphingomonas sp. KC8 TaxID=1030157 RepID=UPI001E3A616A|nr:GNAT family N-acetyltransferase [Sphingomonas sp. KC8]
MAFSDRVMRLCAARASELSIRPANLQEAMDALGHARTKLGDLVSDEIAARALVHNPEIFQLVGKITKGKHQAFLAFLPLNAEGARELASNRFNGKQPDLSLVCKPGETPTAIYIWLIYAPSALAPTLRALAPLLGRLAPAGCPLFTRAVTGHTARLFPAMGFGRAKATYPDAADDLLVLPARSGLPPLAKAAVTPPDTISIRIARTMEDMMKCFSVRAATYMAEQECPFNEEFDGNDFCATHFIGEIDGEPAGCLRVRYFAGFVKLERLAVRQEFRVSRLSFRLVREALSYCRRKGYGRAYGHSRSDLTRFWGLFGFRPIPGRPSFVFSDVEYVELEAALPEADDIIAIGQDPYVLIRPEGDWNRPGPLDLSRDRAAPTRQTRIRARLRGPTGSVRAQTAVAGEA